MALNLEKNNGTRLSYLDNLRSFAIILVICLHAAVTYSGMGNWYYTENPQISVSPLIYLVFGIFQSFTQAWFMGVLFFISAYFASKSLVKKSTSKFIKERLFRLGIPLLFYIVIVSPFIYFIILPSESLSWEYITTSYTKYFSDIKNIRSSGPLWFAQALIVFSCIYAALRHFIPAKEKSRNTIFTTKGFVGIIFLIAIIAFLIRLIFPIGTAISNLQFSYFSSYIILFILGIIAGEKNLFEDISQTKNIKMILFGLIIGIPIWFVVMIFSNVFEGGTIFNGGMNWQSAAYALWEAIIAVSFSFGFIAFFRKNINKGNKLTRILAENSFGVYIFHAPLLVMITISLKWWIINPLIKWLTVIPLTTIVSFIFVMMIRKIKPIKNILK
jgi:peptidoglycan/LPS O-acetylase OafA/YrhL